MPKADLHIHTRVSDGLASVEDLLDFVEHHTALDVIAVTDHEDSRGGQLAREVAARCGYRFEVIVGAEITTIHGHLLALFIEEAPKSFRSVERTLEAIHTMGGVAVVPHPMSWLTRSISQRTIERVQESGEPGVTFDAIEVLNPSPAGRVTAAKAKRLNARWALAETGSSDAHHLLHVGSAWTEFEPAGAGGLRRALTARQTRPGKAYYASLREVGLAKTALGLAWGYAATPRKMLRLARKPRLEG